MADAQDELDSCVAGGHDRMAGRPRVPPFWVIFSRVREAIFGCGRPRLRYTNGPYPEGFDKLNSVSRNTMRLSQ